MSPNCYFCNIRKTDAALWKGNYFLAVLDNYPISPGHSLMFTKRHVSNLDLLNKSEQSVLVEALSQIKSKIRKLDLRKIYAEFDKDDKKSAMFIKRFINEASLNKGPDGFNYGINEGTSAGQTIQHLHIHVIPRFAGDMKDPIGGVRKIFSRRSNYKK
jgi:diadenosine tetraphosphate (Ap4A) HIT family hydrolase